MRESEYKPPDSSMRVLAHRLASRPHHVQITPHFISPVDGTSEEHNSEGFKHFLRSQLHITTMLEPFHLHLLNRKLSERHSLRMTPASMLGQHSMVHLSQYQQTGNEQSEGLPPSHFICTHDQTLNGTIEQLGHAMMEDRYFHALPATHLALEEVVTLAPIMEGYLLEPGHPVLPSFTGSLHDRISYPSRSTSAPGLGIWESVGGKSTLLQETHCGTPGSLHDDRVTTQEDIWGYEPVASDQWTSAGLSYESQVASTPGSIDMSSSEVLTPATSASSHFESFRPSITSAAQSLRDIYSGNPSPPHVQLRQYPSWYSTTGDRTDSPLFPVSNSEESFKTTLLDQQKHAQSIGLHASIEVVDENPEVKARAKDARPRRDAQLVAWRDSGMSYRDIKARGGYHEAESTLRGRYRALTKSSKDRVRKPHWTERDIHLLQLAVSRHYRSGAYGKAKSATRVPWKGVAVWMKGNGASYSFAPATCARKWEEIYKSES